MSTPANTPSDLVRQLSGALACHQRGETDAAGIQYRRILEQHPRCFDALHLLGILLADGGHVDEGVALIRRAIAVDASHYQAHYSLATTLLRMGDTAAALRSVGQALALEPTNADLWLCRGNVLQGANLPEEAAASYSRAIEMRPEFPEAFNNLAAVQRTLRQLPAALDSANRALALQSAYVKALNNRGLILLDGGHRADAVENFQRALRINGLFPEAWHNLGTALMQLKRYDEAREAFHRLLSIAPGFAHAAGNVVAAQLLSCDWAGIEEALAAARRGVGRGEPAAVPMSFLGMSDSGELQRRCATMYARAYFPPRGAPAVARRRGDHDKIRVAYLSGDLGEHAVTYLLAGVFERHDPALFETIALSWGRQHQVALRRRVEAAFSRFIDITDRSDAEVVRWMRDHEVDIAVDLSGHTLGQRTGILAQRAAPVQVNFLGLPATMGAPYIDYLIADRFLVPREHFPHYAESIVWMPGCFQPNDDRRPAVSDPPTRHALGLPPDGFVFCSFNREHKFTPSFFDIWMRLLRAIPGSVLWLLATHQAVEDNLRRESAARGVDPQRLVFAGEAPYADYLARYPLADLFLDTLPFNGGTTVSDALSMGVPVLTCAGGSFAARMAGSLLTNLGLPELVTTSARDYEQTAMTLSREPAQLGELRGKIRRLRDGHAFFDTDRYRRHLESAYRTMMQRCVAGAPPAPFDVALDPPSA